MNSKETRKQKYKEFSDSVPITKEHRTGSQIPPINSLEHDQMEYRNLTKDKPHTQRWPEYNQAQTKEKLIFYRLLDELLNSNIMEQKRLFQEVKPKNKVIMVEVTPDVIIFYNRYLTPSGVVTEQIIKRRIPTK